MTIVVIGLMLSANIKSATWRMGNCSQGLGIGESLDGIGSETSCDTWLTTGESVVTALIVEESLHENATKNKTPNIVLGFIII